MARHKVLRSPRLLRRQRSAQRKKRIAAVLLVATLVGATLYLLMRPQFLITDVTVVGESPIPRAEIAEAVQQELSGRYLFSLPKAHVFLYPRRAIEDALRVRFPVLLSADISLRTLGSVRVSLLERRRVALWCVDGSAGAPTTHCFFLDKSGFAFEKLPDGAPSLYPRFHARAPAVSSPLGTAVIKEERLATFLSLLTGLEALQLPVTETDLLPGEELAVHLRSGGKLLLREDDDFSDERARLAVLLAEKNLVPRSAGEGLRVEYIDLRYGNKIYFKPR